MELVINGETRTLPEAPANVAGLLELLGRSASAGIAIALNGEVVRRADWSERRLAAGDRVEIVGAVQGG